MMDGDVRTPSLTSSCSAIESLNTMTTETQTCLNLPPDGNGHAPAGACGNIWPYRPSREGNIAIAAMFAVLTVAHLIQAIRLKKACVPKVMVSRYMLMLILRNTAGSSSWQESGKLLLSRFVSWEPSIVLSSHT